MNALITEAEYRRQIGKTAGKAYLFFGEEDYLKSADIRLTRASFSDDPSLSAFNDITLDALDYTPSKLLDAMMPPPMMADTRLILLRGMDFNGMRESEVTALLDTLRELEEYDYNTVIVHAAAGMIEEGYLPKRPSALLKRLSEVLIPVRFEASSDAKLTAWIGRHFAHLGVNAGPAECTLLMQRAGKSMFVLAGEAEKIAYYALSQGRRQITPGDIAHVASIAQVPDAFALSNAILSGQSREALSALAVMRDERVEPAVVLGEIARTLSDMQSVRILSLAGHGSAEISEILKIHEYKVKLLLRSVARIDPKRLSRLIDLAAEADLSVKRKGADYAPIEKLVCALS